MTTHRLFEGRLGTSTSANSASFSGSGASKLVSSRSAHLLSATIHSKRRKGGCRSFDAAPEPNSSAKVPRRSTETKALRVPADGVGEEDDFIRREVTEGVEHTYHRQEDAGGLVGSRTVGTPRLGSNSNETKQSRSSASAALPKVRGILLP